jgi:predicted acylesterase/phospholipase RssA
MNMFDTLVLSGNSTNALSTLGSLQKLFDVNVLKRNDIKSLFGTSSGAIICTLLAIGFEPIEILAYICTNKSYTKIQPDVAGFFTNITSNGGLLNFDIIERELDNMIIYKLGFIPTLRCVHERLGKHLVFITYNLTSGMKECLSYTTHPDLVVTKAIRMSSTFPFVFAPYEYDQMYYLDGGLVENFPMFTAQKHSNKCFGIYNNNPPKPYSVQTNYFELFFRLITVFVASSADNIPINPESKVLKLSYPPSFFNFFSNNTELINMFDTGYLTCQQALS